MYKFNGIVKIIGAAVLIGTALPAFAQAPVYDADAVQQQFDSDAANQNQGPDLPPPPPPGQENNTFMPAQTAPVVAENNAPPADNLNLSLDQRVRRVEQQIDNMQNNDASSRMESLQDQVQNLRGQVEQLTHQLEQLQNLQRSLASDVDSRISQLALANSRPVNVAANDTPPAPALAAGAAATGDDNPVPVSTPVVKPGRNRSKPSMKPAVATAATAAAATTATTPRAANSTANQPNVAEEQHIYQTAYNLIKAKKYNEAVTALQGMLKKYPSGQFAANAHYWLGELYGLMNKNNQALTEFGLVVKRYSDSPRVSDAQLKVGLILAAQLRWIDAKAAFKNVINHYPGTASARLASEQLKQIQIAGH